MSTNRPRQGTAPTFHRIADNTNRAAALYDRALVHRHLFERVRDVDGEPDEYPVPETDPPAVAAERVRSHVALWVARCTWEREQRALDAQAAHVATADRARLQALADRDTPTDAQRAAQAADRAHADRLRRVRLIAAQHDLELRVDLVRLPHGPDQESYRLTAPTADHPSLTPAHPWQRPAVPVRVGGRFVVDCDGDDLASVETWLGLDHDGNARRRPHDTESGRALAADHDPERSAMGLSGPTTERTNR